MLWGKGFGRKIELTMYTNRRSLYNLRTSLAHTTDRRNQIDLFAIRAALETRDITNTICTFNVATVHGQKVQSVSRRPVRDDQRSLSNLFVELFTIGS